MSSYSQTLIVTLTLAAGACAAEDGPSKGPGSAESRQQSVQVADAANRLLALSNAAVGVGQVGQRQAFVFDLQAEIEEGATEFMAGLTDESCANVDITADASGNVHVSYDFNACATDLGLQDISGELEIEIAAAAEEVEFDFEGQLEIDGVALAGQWGIDLDAAASAAIEGSVQITVPGFAGTFASLEGSWKQLDGECPELTQSILVEGAEGTTSVDLSGVNLCDFSLCNSDLQVEVSDADGSASVDFSTGEITTDEATVVIPCGEDGLPGWDTGDYSSDDLPSEDDFDPSDFEPGDLDPQQ